MHAQPTVRACFSGQCSMTKTTAPNQSMLSGNGMQRESLPTGPRSRGMHAGRRPCPPQSRLAHLFGLDVLGLLKHRLGTPRCRCPWLLAPQGAGHLGAGLTSHGTNGDRHAPRQACARKWVVHRRVCVRGAAVALGARPGERLLNNATAHACILIAHKAELSAHDVQGASPPAHRLDHRALPNPHPLPEVPLAPSDAAARLPSSRAP